MQQRSDARLARMKARAPRDPTRARRRALLRARAALAAVLRDGLASLDAGAALTRALHLGDAAATELAAIPDTQDLRDSDEALLASDHAGAEEMLEVRLWHAVRQYRDGGGLDWVNASPAELLAAYLAGAEMPPLPSPGMGTGSGEAIG
jgi:hypothetical protein